MRRPIVLIVIAIYCVLAGLAIVLQSVQVVVLEGVELRLQLFGAISFALGVFELIAAYGLLALASWGRILAIVVFSAAIVLTIATLLVAEGAPQIWIAFKLFDIVLAGAIILYLQRPHIRALFADGAPSTAPRP